MPKDLSRYIMEFVSNKSAKLVTEQEIIIEIKSTNHFDVTIVFEFTHSVKPGIPPIPAWRTISRGILVLSCWAKNVKRARKLVTLLQYAMPQKQRYE